MKDFEKILKEKLDNFEMPYESSAWSAMQSKLDAKTTPAKSFKWTYVVAGLCAVTLVAALVFYTQDNTPRTGKQTVEQLKKPENQLNTKKSTHTVSVTKTAENNPENKAKKPTDLTAQNNSSTPFTKHLNQTKKQVASSPDSDVSTPSDVRNPEQKEKNDSNTTDTDNANENLAHDVMHTYIEGLVNTTTLCKKEALIVSNNGAEKELVKTKVNGEITTIKPNESARFHLESNTNIDFLDDANKIIATKAIRVLDLPNAAFSYEANLIEKGIPVVYVESASSLQRTWKLNNEDAVLVDDSHIATFEAGQHTLSSTVTDNNGCTATEVKTININKAYNLLAPTAFIPNSTRIENMFFMPVALEQRNTGFTLIIVSTQDGGVVFETTDATVKWDGIDNRTGALVDYNTPFIWQVKLDNPLPNEKNTYKGTVQVLKTP